VLVSGPLQLSQLHISFEAWAQETSSDAEQNIYCYLCYKIEDDHVSKTKAHHNTESKFN